MKCKNCGSTGFEDSHVVEGLKKCVCCGLHYGDDVYVPEGDFRRYDLVSRN